MNDKIVLKIARHLINSIYNDLSKIEILDKVYMNKENDMDCEIILNMIKIIRTENILSISILKKLYYSIPPTDKVKFKISDDKLNKLIKYCKFHTSIEISKYILKNNVFYDHSFYMMVLIFNNIIYFQEKKLYVIFLFTKNELIKRSKKTFNDFDNYFQLILNENKCYYAKKKIFSINEIKNIISKIDYNIVDFFRIKKIYLYGSYVKNEVNEYSDIDLFICSNILKTNIDICTKMLTQYFVNLFESGCDIHIHIEKSKFSNFENNIIEYSLMLFNQS